MAKFKLICKRGCALLIVLALAAGSINCPSARAGVYGQDVPPEEKVLVNKTRIVVEDEYGISNNELFDGYLEQLFYGGAVSYSLGNFDLSMLETDEERALYSALKNVLTEIGNGERESTIIAIDDIIEGGIKFSIEYANGNNEELPQEVQDIINAKIDNILYMLLADCPYELYWYNKLYGCAVEYNASYSDGRYEITNLYFGFDVASDYAQLYMQDGQLTYDNYAIDTDMVKRAQEAKSAADNIVAKYALLDDYDKLHAYMEEICSLNEYNQEETDAGLVTYTDPWQLVYVFDGDPDTNVVCEGYAKAFAYLCEKSTFENDIRCYIVTGILTDNNGDAGPHMWNIVTMEDGKNYMADITNCDGNSIGNPDMLFLAGLPGSASTKYVFTRNGQDTYFEYDNVTKSLYPGQVLGLSDKSYVKKVNQEDLAIVAIPDKTYGDADFELSTKGGSGKGAVTWSVPEDNGVLVLDGNKASITGAGKVTITAVKAEDDNYKQAEAEYTLEIARKSLTPVVTGTVVKYYDGNVSVEGAVENTLSASLNGVLDKDKGKVEVSADFAYRDAGAGTEKEVIASNISLSGDAAGNYYLESETVTAVAGTIKEARKDQELLSVKEVAGKVYGDGDFVLQVTGGSGNGTVTYSVPEDNGVIVLDGNKASITGAGKVTITVVKAGDDIYNPAETTYVLEVAKKSLIPLISGTVIKKYDKTTSVENATVNTLSISLEGVLEKDKTKVSAAAKYNYESADTGNNKKVIASDIVLSGEMSGNYTLSTDMVSADTGNIEPAVTGGNTGIIWNTGSNTSGGSTGDTTGSSPSGTATSSPDTGNNVVKPTNTPVPDVPVMVTPAPLPSPSLAPVQNTTDTNTVTNPDGSVTTTVTETDGQGNITQVIKTTTISKDGAEDIVTTETVIGNIVPGTTASVITKASGNVIKEANAYVSKTTGSGNKITLSKDETGQIIKAAGTTDVKITITAKDAAGKEQYKVNVYTKDLAAGNKLYIYELNTKTGEYIMVNSKVYTVNNTGNIQISIKGNKTYGLVTESDSQKINNKIYNTIAVKKTSANVKKGKKMQFVLNSKLNKSNIKSITYSSSKKKIVSVSSKGKMTAKKPGTVTVKAKVVLKNGMKKTISMKIKVK